MFNATFISFVAAVAALVPPATPRSTAEYRRATPNERHDLSSLTGAWIGGIEFQDGFLLTHLRFQVRGNDVSGTLEFLDRPRRDPQRFDSVIQDSGGVRFSVFDGIVQVSIGENDLIGAYTWTTSGSVQEREARWRRVADVEATDIQGHAAWYELPTGKTFRIDAVQPGFLRMYDHAAGTFQNLYPRSADEFFYGPDLERPSPVRGVVSFRNDQVEIATAEDGVLGPPEVARAMSRPVHPVRWSESGETARLELPGGVPMTFVRVAPGTFEMGEQKTADELVRLFGPELEEAFRSNAALLAQYQQRHTRRVTLSSGFWLGQFEVTNRQFAAFVSTTGYMTDAERRGRGMEWNGSEFNWALGRNWRSPGYDTDPEHPVTMLTWYDVVALAEWLREVTGMPIRLPTEAEWEYAARAGSDDLFDFGDDVSSLDAHAHFGQGSGDEKGWSPIPVGRKLPNRWGFHDMQGNVWEWTQDKGGDLSSEPATDPRGPADGDGRVLRGGSWLNGPFSLRLGFRPVDSADLMEPHFGFRLLIER